MIFFYIFMLAYCLTLHYTRFLQNDFRNVEILIQEKENTKLFSSQNFQKISILSKNMLEQGIILYYYASLLLTLALYSILPKC